MDRPWDDRRLHFVGIGGAGMSGLALVAQELGAIGHRLRPLRRLLLRGAAARGRDRARRRPRRRQRARRAPRSSTRPRSARRTRSARSRPARAAPRRPARRADAAAADDRRLRHPRQDDDLEHARPRAARQRARIRPTWSAARCARPARTPAGGRGSGWWSRPTSPTGRCSSSTAGSRCSPTQSSTITRPTARGATSRRRSASSWARRRTRWCGTGRSCSRWRRAARACGRSTSSPSSRRAAPRSRSTASPWS